MTTVRLSLVNKRVGNRNLAEYVRFIVNGQKHIGKVTFGPGRAQGRRESRERLVRMASNGRAGTGKYAPLIAVVE